MEGGGEKRNGGDEGFYFMMGIGLGGGGGGGKIKNKK